MLGGRDGLEVTLLEGTMPFLITTKRNRHEETKEACNRLKTGNNKKINQTVIDKIKFETLLYV